MVFDAEEYWLKNARVPIALLKNVSFPLQGDLAQVDLRIRSGRIAEIVPAGNEAIAAMLPHQPIYDMRQGILFPCFVDLHTHLDKGHIWGRAPNRTGSFDDALQTVAADSQKNWNAEDVYRRMEFGLRCAYAHGTQAIRTHIDSFGEQAAVSFGVFKRMRQEWADRIQLQAASLVSLDYYLTPEGEKLADLVAEVGGVLGGVTIVTPELPQQLDRLFALASDRHLDLDIHTDESGDPSDDALRQIADTAIRHNFKGQIVCGHCCSLAVQTAQEAATTIDRVRQAGIGIVSLPMCNLYLQDRNQTSALNGGSLEEAILPTKTPRWRGVTLVHELKQAGVAVAFASDNCRDSFYSYGDHDGLEVFTQATRIAQLDAPYSDWSRSVTATPAALMKLPQTHEPIGEIAPGAAADLILFRARYYSELFARPQLDRIVLRQGKAIDQTLPDYAELDDLIYR